MKCYTLIVLALFMGCQDKINGSSQQQLPHLESDGSPSFSGGMPNGQENRHPEPNLAQADDDQSEPVKRANFDQGNWIDFNVKLTEATITSHVSEFKKSAVFLIGPIGGDKFDSLEKLRDFCAENRYETAGKFARLAGQISVYVNPLNESVSAYIANHFLKETITAIKNPFVILDADIKIEADYLTQEERYFLQNHDVLRQRGFMDHLMTSLFNPLAGTDEHLSSLLVRLYCGIANNRADIFYTFHDKDGHVLKVRINRVTFKHIGY